MIASHDTKNRRILRAARGGSELRQAA
jgi:hypothetical protein